MQILVIRFSSMGDVILSTPVFDYIKSVYPDAEITFLTDKNYVELFSDDSRLKGVLGFHKSDDLNKLPIIHSKWDQIIDLQNSKKSRLIINLIRNKTKVSVFKKLHLQRLVLLYLRINCYPPNSEVILRYLKAAGFESTNEKNPFNTPKLSFNKISNDNYDSMLQCDTIVRPVIALFPFSAWKNKEWPLKFYSTVGRYFVTLGWNVVIMGSPAEKEQAEQLRSLISIRVNSLAGRISLYECGCVLSKCSLALGNDSGLSHLARACGVKTGIIYGPTTRHFGFYPSGLPAFKIFESQLKCRPCHAHGGNICVRFNHICMKGITPDIVIRELMKLFHEN